MISKETLRIRWATAVAVILMLWSNPSWGITLTWNPNTETDLAGYYIYQCSQQPCSRTSGTATRLATLGKVTSFNAGTPAVIQYYLITAYDFANNESNESTVATYIPAGTPPPPTKEPVVVTIDIDFDGTVLWNGEALPDRAMLESRLSQAAAQPDQPEGHIRPNKLVEYKSVAMVLASAQRLGVTKLGMVGNEQFVKAMTTTLDYAPFSTGEPCVFNNTHVRLEHRWDESTGGTGGVFRQGDIAPGVPGLTGSQHLIILGLLWTFDRRSS